jgi:FMN phosphatase YigB (HAD superfamily)
MALIREEVKARAAGKDYVAAYDWDGIVAAVGRRLSFQGNIDVAELVRENCTPEHIHSYPGVHETLAQLKEAGHALVALTNGFAKYQVPVLEALGLMQYLAGVYTPEIAGFAKPDAEFFAAVRRDFGLPHLHVGDTVAHDLWGANKSGAWSVWVYHDLPREIAELPLQERTRHPELLSIIERALAKDLMVSGYPELTAEDCLPHFVTAEISDLVEIVELVEGYTEAAQ